jgi:hypothetical protein
MRTLGDAAGFCFGFGLGVAGFGFGLAGVGAGRVLVAITGAEPGEGSFVSGQTVSTRSIASRSAGVTDTANLRLTAIWRET